MKIKVGQKYKYGFGGDEKKDTVKVLAILEDSDGQLHIKYRHYFGLFVSFVETDYIETFRDRIDSPIIIKKHKEING